MTKNVRAMVELLCLSLSTTSFPQQGISTSFWPERWTIAFESRTAILLSAASFPLRREPPAADDAWRRNALALLPTARHAASIGTRFASFELNS
jgi:hypothetical protein